MTNEEFERYVEQGNSIWFAVDYPDNIEDRIKVETEIARRQRENQVRRSETVAAKRQIVYGLRFKVLEKFRFTCQYCGAKAPDVKLVVDHIIPIAQDGTSDLDNLTVACEPCNLGKGARILSVKPEALQD